MILPPAVIKKILSCAEAACPAECCGLVSKSDALEMRVWPIRNIQDEKHREVPEKFPRTAKEAYWMDPAELLRAQKQMRQNAARLFVIYHSHTNGEAYFSAEDERLALDEFGEPLYPDVFYFVIPVKNSKASEGIFFKWNPEFKKFSSYS